MEDDVLAMDSPRRLPRGVWGVELEIFVLCIIQHLRKLLSCRNFLARTTKLAEVGVVVVTAWITNIGWFEKSEVRVSFVIADVRNKAVAVVGGGEEESGAR